MSDELEARIHRALRALPVPPAPVTLAPRVMLAVERRVSAAWRAVALAGVLAAGVLLVLVLPWVAGAAGGGGTLAQVASLFAGVERVAGAVNVTWRMAEPALVWMAWAVFGMGAIAAAGGLALGRLARHAEG